MSSADAATILASQKLRDPISKLVLLTLMMFSDSDGITTLSWGTLSKLCSVSRSTIARVMRALEADGLILVLSGYGQAPNLYRVQLAELEARP